MKAKWREFREVPGSERNPEASIGMFVDYFGSLNSRDKSRANRTLARWLDGTDYERYRLALHVVHRYQIVGLLPAVRQRLKRIDMQIESISRTTADELLAVLESERGFPAQVAEELENPEVGAERQRLRRAYHNVRSTQPPLPKVALQQFLDASNLFDGYREVVRMAGVLLTGKEVDRSVFRPDLELRRSLTDLLDDDNVDVRRTAGSFVAYLDLIDELLDAARTIRNT